MCACQLVENKNIIVLVDANNFFVSCERAFNPDLIDKPVVVLSNNDGNVISRSEEAKKLGVHMGEVFYQKKRWYDQKQIHYFSSNYTVYAAKSQQVIRILSRYTNRLEYYSVDEAWLDLTHVGNEAIEEYCREIKRAIWEESRIPCSFGIGRNKTQAKLAASFAKKQPKVSGVMNLIDHPLYEAVLKKTSIDTLWGINRRLTKRLQTLGVHTAFDLAEANIHLVSKKTNINVAKIAYELRNQYCFDFQKPKPPQMLSVSVSFSYETNNFQDILEATACYVARAAARLRQNQMAARHIIVILSTNHYSKNQEYKAHYGEASLASYSIYTPDFISVAQQIARQCFDSKTRYHKVTVILSDLMPIDQIQTSLWDERNWEKMLILMGLVDVLNERFGEGSFRFREEGTGHRWKNKRAHVSGATIENMKLQSIDPNLFPICRMGTDAMLVDGFS